MPGSIVPNESARLWLCYSISPLFFVSCFAPVGKTKKFPPTKHNCWPTPPGIVVAKKGGVVAMWQRRRVVVVGR